MTSRCYGVPDDIAWLSPGSAATPSTYLARLPDGPIVVLQHPAGLIWSAALERTADEVVKVVRATVEDPPDALDAIVLDFLDRLVDQGWLVLDKDPAAQ